MNARRRLLLLGLLAVFAGLCAGQDWFGPGGGRRGWRRDWSQSSGPMVQTEGGDPVNEDTVRTARETAEHSTETANWTNTPGFEKDVFTFTRIVYKMGSWPAPSWLGWINDYPDSDLNLSYRLKQLTSMKVDPDGRVLKLTNADLFDYPFIFAAQVGHLSLRDEEVTILRKYLLNGGVFLADDFWGPRDWANFEREMKRVLPEHSWEELPMTHPIFHCVFNLGTTMNDLQVPTIHFWRRGWTESPFRGQDMHLRAWLDDKKRIMVVAIHNSDTGDGWEREGEDFEYFQTFSEKRAYPLGINIIFYLMTH